MSGFVSSAIRIGALATCLAATLTSAFAQGPAPLPSMPMPPSASDPAPRDSTKPKVPPKRQVKKKESDADTGTAQDAPRSRRNAGAAAKDGFERPNRYVPEEFDRSGQAGGSQAKPFVNESGRAGMGMKF